MAGGAPTSKSQTRLLLSTSFRLHGEMPCKFPLSLVQYAVPAFLSCRCTLILMPCIRQVESQVQSLVWQPQCTVGVAAVVVAITLSASTVRRVPKLTCHSQVGLLCAHPLHALHHLAATQRCRTSPSPTPCSPLRRQCNPPLRWCTTCPMPAIATRWAQDGQTRSRGVTWECDCAMLCEVAYAGEPKLM